MFENLGTFVNNFNNMLMLESNDFSGDHPAVPKIKLSIIKVLLIVASYFVEQRKIKYTLSSFYVE